MLQAAPRSDRRRRAASARQARSRAGRVTGRSASRSKSTRRLREADAGDRAAIGRALQAMLGDAAR
jgi:hypothetical protein